MDDKEISSCSEIRLEIFGMLAVFFVKFVDVGFVCCLWEPTFFIQQCQDTHWFLNQVNRRLQVQSKVNEFPFNAFFLILFLQDDKRFCHQIQEFSFIQHVNIFQYTLIRFFLVACRLANAIKLRKKTNQGQIEY